MQSAYLSDSYGWQLAILLSRLNCNKEALDQFNIVCKTGIEMKEYIAL